MARNRGAKAARPSATAGNAGKAGEKRTSDEAEPAADEATADLSAGADQSEPPDLGGEVTSEAAAEPAGGDQEDQTVPARPGRTGSGRKSAAKKAATGKPPARKGAAKTAPAKAPAKQAPGKQASGKQAPGKAASKDATAKDLADGDAGDAGDDDQPAAEEEAAQPKKAPKKESATAQRAAQARVVLQRQHRRTELLRATAIGVELVGAAGLVAASLLPWEWGQRLWGRDDNLGLMLQIALVITVLLLVAAWLVRPDPRGPRPEWLRVWARTGGLIAAGVVALGSVAAVWLAELGGRDSGGLVAIAASLLVVVGSTGWLVGARRLRKLFAFGMRQAKVRGYGNLPSVRRAKLIGVPAGAVGAAAVVAAAVLVAPGWVSSVDHQVAAAPLGLTAGPPAGAQLIWTIDLPANAALGPAVRSAPNALLVDEVHGIRGVDPRDGSTHWYWRDRAYQRVATAPTDGGDTVVLGLQFLADEEEAADPLDPFAEQEPEPAPERPTGRDRLVGLDSATGEQRWERFDDDVVSAMTELLSPSQDGSWFAIPDRIEPPVGDPEVDPAASPGGPAGVQVVDSDTGETRWRLPGADECQLAGYGTDNPEVLVVTENCQTDPGPGTDACEVTGRDAVEGRQVWTWPTADVMDSAEAYPSNCRVYTREGLVLISYEVTMRNAEPEEERLAQATALATGTGEEVWTIDREEESYSAAGVDGFLGPEVVGDTMVGMEWIAGGPDAGPAALLLRDLADGSRTSEIELPAGQPIGVRPAGDDRIFISHYERLADRVLLLEVDLAAGEVVTQREVIAGVNGGGDVVIGSAGMSVGPSTAAVDTLVAADYEAGPDDFRLLVHGYG